MTPPRSLRAVHLVLGLDLGGLEMVVLDLVRMANRGRVSPSVISLGEYGDLVPRFKSLGVEVVPLRTRGRLHAVSRLLREIVRVRPDVIHTHNPVPHQVGAVARLFARIPVLVHTKHGRNHPDRRPSVLANRLASSRSDAVVAVSSDAAQVATGIERVPPEKVMVLRNGVDLSRYRPISRARTTNGQCRAICVARLNHVKDHDTLLRATRRIVDQFPDFHLDLLGDGPCRPALEGLRQQLNLNRNVALLGSRDDVAERLGQADIFVLSSKTEGMCLSLLEAMACALPVVATDVGGNREAVSAGETGLLVASGSPEAFADALLRLVSNQELRERMGGAGRRRAEAEFDLRAVVSRYEDLYVRLWLRNARNGHLGAVRSAWD